ncbi:MAG: aldehyde dehydrogenase (NADP(+)), partial [Streptomycetales bacterium]
GELLRTTNQLRLFAEVVMEGSFLGVSISHPEAVAQPAPFPDVRRLNVPLGVVAVFAASNFPFAFSVAGGDTASALAAGCPVVVKAHPGHPVLSARVGDILADALARGGAPAGVLHVVHGFAAGEALVRHPEVAAVGFTGSLRGGMALWKIAAERDVPVPVFAEMGSTNPLVVTEAAWRARGGEIARGVVGSFTLGMGQFCTKPGILLVPAGSDLVERIADIVAETDAAGHLLGPGIAHAYATRSGEWARRPGVTERARARSHAGEGLAAAPLVLEVEPDAFLADGVLREECFGPLTLAVSYRDRAELLRLIDVLPGTLVGTLHAEESEGGGARELLQRLAQRAGRVVWNGYPTGVAVNWAMQHGGPYPATTAAAFTSVGASSIVRWLRPVAWQNVPEALLPPQLREDNPLGLPRRVDGRIEADS